MLLIAGQFQKDAFQIAVIARRLPVQLGHGAAGDELAFLDDADPVANFFGDADAVRREKNRRAGLCQRTEEIFERTRPRNRPARPPR